MSQGYLSYLILVAKIQIVSQLMDLDEKILENKILECHKSLGELKLQAEKSVVRSRMNSM